MARAFPTAHVADGFRRRPPQRSCIGCPLRSSCCRTATISSWPASPNGVRGASRALRRSFAVLSDDLSPPAALQVANLVKGQLQPLVCFLSRSKPSVWVERGAALAVVLSRDRERFTVMSWPRRPPQLRAATLRLVDTGSKFEQHSYGIRSQSLRRALQSFDAAKAEVDSDPGHVPHRTARAPGQPALVMLAQGRRQWWLGVNLEPLGCLSE